MSLILFTFICVVAGLSYLLGWSIRGAYAKRPPDNELEEDLLGSELEQIINWVEDGEKYTACCGYYDTSAVRYNPFNQKIQCHNCGIIYAEDGSLYVESRKV